MQEYINIMYSEGRLEELIAACDFYHLTLSTTKEAFEWGMHLGEYMGKFRRGECIYRFEVIDGITVLYFIGEHNYVKDKLYNLL